MTRNYSTRRPASLPAPVAEALAKYDDLLARSRQADRDLAALATPERAAEAEAADRRAAVEAVTAGKPVPAGKAAEALRADLDKARRAAEAYTAATADAAAALSTACTEAANDGEQAEQERRAAAVARLIEQAEALAEAINSEAVARATHSWLRTGELDDAAWVAAWDVIPMLRGRGIGPGVDRPRDFAEPAGAVVRRVIGAAFGGEV